MKPAIVLLVFVATQVASQNLTSTLHTTFYDVNVAYVDEMVVFTCVLRGSNNLIWTSDEYVGPRRQLSLVSAQPPQTEVRAIGNDQTVAVLINATIDVFIESELRIRVVPTYPTASVQCVNGASRDAQSSTLFRLDDPASVVCDRQLVCPGVTVTCTCATANSDTLAWIINGTREEFMSSDTLPARRDVVGSSGFVVLTENSNVNGIRVIMSNLTVSVSSSGIILTCENVDQSMTQSTIIPIDENCPTDPVTTSSGNQNAAGTGSDSGVIAAAVIVPVILLGPLLIVAVVTLIILYLKCKPLQDQLNEKDAEKDRLVKEKDAEKECLVKEKDAEKERLVKEKDDEKERLVKEKDAEKERLVKEKDAEKERLVKEKNQQLVQKAKEVSSLENSMALQSLQVGENEGELKKLRNELKDKDNGLPAKMKVAWMDALRTLESEMKKEQAGIIIGLKAKLMMIEIDQVLQDKVLQDKGTGAAPKGGSMKRGLMKSKDKTPSWDSSADEGTRNLEGKMTKDVLQGDPMKDLPTEMKEKMLNALKDIMVAEINKLLLEEEMAQSVEKKGESAKRAPKGVKESALVCKEAEKLERKMEEEINKIVGKEETMLHGQQGTLGLSELQPHKPLVQDLAVPDSDTVSPKTSTTGTSGNSRRKVNSKK